MARCGGSRARCSRRWGSDERDGSPALKKTSTAIEQRALGRGGATTAILALGARALDGLGQQETVSLVREAIDLGVNVLEIVPGCADGRTERSVALALKDGYRDRVQLLWQCCAYRRDYKTAMQQLESTLALLRTERVDLWSFHEMSYDNDPEWMHENGGLDAALEARVQGKARWIGFQCEKSPHIALRAMARGEAWDAVLMPVNPFDATYRSFERQVLPEVIRRGGAVIGTRTLAGGSIPGCKTVKVDEAYRYAWSLPVSCVLADCASVAELRKTAKLAAGYQAFRAGEMDALRQRAKAVAGDGRFERYKSTQELDGAAARAEHGF